MIKTLIVMDVIVRVFVFLKSLDNLYTVANNEFILVNRRDSMTRTTRGTVSIIIAIVLM